SPTVRTCGRSCSARSRDLVDPATRPGCAHCGRAMEGAVTSVRCFDCHRRFGSFVGYLRAAGVLGDKHIPSGYLRASETQRRALLAGLLDTDGTVTSTGNIQFTSTCRRLAHDAYELVTSLGYRCTIATKRVGGHTEATSA